MTFRFLIQQQGRPFFRKRKWFSLCFLFLCLFFFNANPALLLSKEGENPLERREEKLKAFRQKRDKFFKEDFHSPLKEVDRKKFQGLRYYPIDLNYAMVGRIERYSVEPRPLYTNLPTNKGNVRKYVKYGRFKFKWMGKGYALQIYRPLGGGELFAPFKDKTSETETYPHGRYLYIESMPGREVLIDFNRAYNPFCAFNGKYTCPFAPEENRIDIPIRAGEKRFP
jgi:uncharacterized protein (DUF1684 family)